MTTHLSTTAERDAIVEQMFADDSVVISLVKADQHESARRYAIHHADRIVEARNVHRAGARREVLINLHTGHEALTENDFQLTADCVLDIQRAAVELFTVGRERLGGRKGKVVAFKADRQGEADLDLLMDYYSRGLPEESPRFGASDVLRALIADQAALVRAAQGN